MCADSVLTEVSSKVSLTFATVLSGEMFLG